MRQLAVKLKPKSFSDSDQEIISDKLAEGNPYALTHVKCSGDTPFQCANTPPHPEGNKNLTTKGKGGPIEKNELPKKR